MRLDPLLFGGEAVVFDVVPPGESGTGEARAVASEPRFDGLKRQARPLDLFPVLSGMIGIFKVI